MDNMDRARSIFVIGLALLFMGLSFNAYACLVPIFETPHSAMERGCSDTEDESPRIFCDGFKTLGFQSPEKVAPLLSALLCETTHNVIGLTPSARFSLKEIADGSPPLREPSFSVLRI